MFVLISLICLLQSLIAPFYRLCSKFSLFSKMTCFFLFSFNKLYSRKNFSALYCSSTFLILSFYFLKCSSFSCFSNSALIFKACEALENLSKFLAFKASDFCELASFASDKETFNGTSGLWWTTSLAVERPLPVIEMLLLSLRDVKFLLFW